MGQIDTLPEPRLKPLDGPRSELPADAAPAAVRPRKIGLRRSRAESGAIGLLSLMLIAQMAWTFRVEILQSPIGSAWRATCARLDCAMPVLSAPKLLQASDILVRSHPHIRGALVATMQIENTANFRQPFPDVMLTLSDRFDRVLARKTFPPQSYRHGELAGRQFIESGQPILVALNFTDPDEAAISYTFHFYRAKRP